MQSIIYVTITNQVLKSGELHLAVHITKYKTCVEGASETIWFRFSKFLSYRSMMLPLHKLLYFFFFFSLLHSIVLDVHNIVEISDGTMKGNSITFSAKNENKSLFKAFYYVPINTHTYSELYRQKCLYR